MPITPSITTNLVFAIEFGVSSVWQDSSRTTSATTNDPIGAIDDQSGNGFHAIQTSSGAYPNLGTESYELNGTSHYLIIDDLAAYMDDKADFTFYLAVDLSGSYASTYHTIASAGITTADSPSWTCYNYGGSDQWRTHLRTDLASNRWGSASVTVPTGKQVVVIQGNSTGISIWQDGSQASESTFDAGSMGLTVASIGTQRRQAASETRFMEMNLYGAYLYSTAHGTTDMATITSDLEAMLGLGNQTVSPSLISLGTIPNVSIDASYTVSPSVIALGATVEQPTINPSLTISPSLISLGTVEQPSIQAGSISVSPSVISLGATVEQPTIQAGATNVSPSVISLGTVEQVSIQVGDATISPSVISLGTVEQVSIQVGNVTVSPSLISLGTVELPSVQDGAVDTILPTTISNPAIVPNVSIQSTYTISPSVISLGATVEQVSAQRGDATISPSLISLSTVELPTIQAGSTSISPNLISLGTVEQVSIQTGATSVSPSLISLNATVEQVSLSNVVTISPNIISLGTVEQPSIQAGSTSVSPSIIALNPSVYDVTINPDESDEDDSKLDFIFFAIRRK